MKSKKEIDSPLQVNTRVSLMEVSVRRVISVCVALSMSVSLGGCGSLRTDSSPSVLVDSDQLSLAIYAYVEATRQLADDGGFTSADLVPKSKMTSMGSSIAGFSSVGGPAADDTVDINQKFPSNAGPDNTKTVFPKPTFIDSAFSGATTTVVVAPTSDLEYFLRTGTAAAGMLCQEYVAGLADKQDLLSYLKKQFGFTGTLVSTAFAIYNASSISKSVLEAGTSFVDSSVDSYGDYRFLSPSDESVLDIALQAQHALFKIYTDPSDTKKLKPKTFSEALAAMHNIEHQCTRAGLRALINKSVQNVQLQVNDNGQVTTAH